MLWLGTGILPSFICALMVFPIIYTDTLGAIRETRKDYTDAGMIFFPKVIHRIKYV
jgi:ABC-type nitrate/sulfonate/bicarbonate transport system permease component